MLGRFHHDQDGLELIEYVILATLMAALMTLVMVAFFNTLARKTREINDSL